MRIIKTFALLALLGISSYSPTSATPMKAHPPLVTDHGNGKFSTDPRIDLIRQDLVNMSKVAFLIRKNDPTVPKILDAFKNDGWNISMFKGKSGQGMSIDDTPGFVAYKARENLMIVTFRGSDSTVVNPKTGKAADWEVNFDATMIDTPEGKKHQGFYTKVQAAHASLMETVRQYVAPLSPEQKASLQIYLTGHSQGAALAPEAALQMAKEIKQTNLLGPNFDNAKSNTIKVYVFSAPRSMGDQAALDAMHGTLGKHNIIRQNVTGAVANDVVTVASAGKTATSLLKLIPIVGQPLAEKYGGGSDVGAGARSVGYLAADKSDDVAKRISNTETSSLLQQNTKDIAQAAKNVISKPTDVVNNIKSLAQTAKSIATRSVTSIIAPLHYAGIKHESPVEEGTAYTSTHVMGGAPSTSQLLSQGHDHKATQRSGIGGAIRRNIETLADKKVELENKALAGAKNALNKATELANKTKNLFTNLFKK